MTMNATSSTPSLEGTQTATNLMKAFAGESQARNRYTFYEKIARQEGYIQIENIFHEKPANEESHAKRFFIFLNDGGLNQKTVDIGADFPVALNDTLTNLVSASQGEHEEWHDLYPEFAKVADEEGFPIIAATFRNIAKVEQHHEERFLTLADNMKNDQVFRKDAKVAWICQVCGYIHEGEEAPKICPACQHPQGFYKLWVRDY